MTTNVIEMRPVHTDSEKWAALISAAWRSSVEGIIRTSQLLAAAKANTSALTWRLFVKDLPFGGRTAQMLLSIAANSVLCDANHGSCLPPSWRTIYELSKWSPAELNKGMTLDCPAKDLRADLWITPQSSRKDIQKLRGVIRQSLRSGATQVATPRAPAARSKPFMVLLRAAIGANKMKLIDTAPPKVQRAIVAACVQIVGEQLEAAR